MVLVLHSYYYSYYCWYYYSYYLNCFCSLPLQPPAAYEPVLLLLPAVPAISLHSHRWLFPNHRSDPLSLKSMLKLHSVYPEAVSVMSQVLSSRFPVLSSDHQHPELSAGTLSASVCHNQKSAQCILHYSGIHRLT